MAGFKDLLITLGLVCLGLGVAWFVPGEPVVFGMSAMMVCALLSFAVNGLVYIPSAINQTERFFDLTGSATYLVLVVAGLALAPVPEQASPYRWIMAIMVAVWAIRLGTFLFRRIQKDGKDGRFDTLKTHPLTFLVTWTLQGVWVLFTCLAVLIVIVRDGTDPPMSALTYLGWFLWLFGFGFEVLSDVQKSRFKADLTNSGRWIDSGLWRWSQHPNYFGEITLWLGLFISGIPLYEGLEWLAAISPLFVGVLLCKVSGIPLLDARAQARWGDDPEYQRYCESTSKLIPWPPGPRV